LRISGGDDESLARNPISKHGRPERKQGTSQLLVVHTSDVSVRDAVDERFLDSASLRSE
jgi:hypothetical protein